MYFGTLNESERSLLNKQSWRSHNAVLHSCNPFFEIGICKSLSERKKKHLRSGPSMTKHCRNYRIRWQKKIDFSYSDPGGTLENKLNDLIPLFSRKKGFAFKKRRVNLADQTKQQSQRVSRTINDLSVWNKPLIDTYNIVRLACVASVSNRRES